MNIFILDESPVAAAQYQHDRHVVKMIVETCQMLSTALRIEQRLAWRYMALFDEQPKVSEYLMKTLYKPTHANHPCNMWARATPANFTWLTQHLCALLNEYEHRFPNRQHACCRLRDLFVDVAATLRCSSASRAAFAICAGEYSIAGDAVASYRNLYLKEKIFQNHVKWTNRSRPDWIQ